MKKKKITRGEFGVKIEYKEEEERIPDVCRGCAFHPFGGSCLAWKYLNPALCKALREDIDKEFENRIPYESPPRKESYIIRVLAGFKHSADPNKQPTGYSYKYRKITLMDGQAISIEFATEAEWIKYELEGKKKCSKPFPPISECPPHNPWI